MSQKISDEAKPLILRTSEVERRFAYLGISNRFADREKEILDSTTDVAVIPAGFLAFPTPVSNIGLNLLKLREILGVNPARQPSFFDHPWYLNEQFAAKDCEAGLHLIRMEVLPESIGQPIHYAGSLSARGLALPFAIEVALMVLLHYVGTGKQLLNKKHTWCLDQAGLDRFVTVGAFGRNGLFVSSHPPGYASRGLGICAKVKPPLKSSSG